MMHQAGLLASGYNASHAAFHSSIKNSGLCSFLSLLSCSPVTVARLRRIRTDFPILPGSHTGHLMVPYAIHRVVIVWHVG